MTLSQFLDLLARLGPALRRWPADALGPALDLLQASLHAQDAFIHATALDLVRAPDLVDLPWRQNP